MREMKDSGIEWIGEIPDNWKILPVYKLFCERKNLNRLGREMNLLSLSYGRIVRKNIDTKMGLLPANFNTYNVVEKNDIIIRPTDLQNDKKSLRTGLVAEHGIITSAYIAITPEKGINASYFHYLLHSYDVQKVFYNMGNGVRQGLNYSEFCKLLLVSPPTSEQQDIADFLDARCSELDALAADIRSQIDTLKEYKKSLITHAVTKGLNPQAEMKDSGVEWIGAIPEGWKILPVYKLFRERKNINRLGREMNLLSLSYGRIIRKNINAKTGLLPANFNTYNVVERNDIIIRPTDLQNDKKSLRTGLVAEHGIITSAYIAITPEKGINASYFHYLLHSYDVQKVFYNMGNGVRQGLNYSEFCKLLLVCPPALEQQSIADFLDAKCSELDGLISAKEQQLAALSEYKKSLIYQYVTGKRQALSK